MEKARAVKKLAKKIWEVRGRPEGADEENWRLAEEYYDSTNVLDEHLSGSPDGWEFWFKEAIFMHDMLQKLEKDFWFCVLRPKLADKLSETLFKHTIKIEEHNMFLQDLKEFVDERISPK